MLLLLLESEHHHLSNFMLVYEEILRCHDLMGLESRRVVMWRLY